MVQFVLHPQTAFINAFTQNRSACAKILLYFLSKTRRSNNKILTVYKITSRSESWAGWLFKMRMNFEE